MKYAITAIFAMLLVGCNDLSTKDVVDNVESGVVLITDELDNGQGGIGTGFIVKDNVIVTNNHVISEPGKLFVYSPNSQKKYEAEVAFKDEIYCCPVRSNVARRFVHHARWSG